MQRWVRVLGVLTLLCGAGRASAEYKLVWSEEFDAAAVDARNFKHEVYFGVASDARELSAYTARPENARIENGRLIISARHEDYDLADFTSARLSSYGKQQFRYGRIEARVKLPHAEGVQAKIWLLPDELTYGGWGASGEIYLLDVRGAEVRSGVYCGGSGPDHEHITNLYEGPTVLDGEYHVFGLEWQPYELRWSVDGETYAVINQWSSANAPYPAPFDQPFYLMLGVAVREGVDPAKVDWPQEMAVDWIRVHQAEGNRAPRIKLTAPADGAKIGKDQPVVIKAHASDPDDDPVKVEFYNGKTLLGVDDERPYRFEWDAPDGCYHLVVRALDAVGYASADSVDIERGIGCPPTPYHGEPIALPGKVEAEDFDASVKGESYFDVDEVNHGGAYRRTPVDLQDCREGGVNLCWMIDNEWTQYTVDVARTGKYDIRCRVASPNDTARFHLEFDGRNVTGSLVAPNTGDWQNWTDLVVRGVELSAGRQIMRMFVENDGFNLNYIEVTPAD